MGKKFVRTNPRSDLFNVKRFHHIEFYSGDAINAASRFSWGLGMPIVAKSDLSTGNPVHASYLLSSGELNFVFTSAYSPTTYSSSSSASIPSFSPAVHRAFVASHGLAVRAVAVEVEDAEQAFSTSVSRGANPVAPPIVLRDGRTIIAEVHLFGDVVLRFVSVAARFLNEPSQLINEPNPGLACQYPNRINSLTVLTDTAGCGGGDDSNTSFLPGFEAENNSYLELDYGICKLDHAVGNVPKLYPALEYLKKFTGFHEFAEFTADEVGTLESGLNSMVLANNNETVLLPLNEPVYGMKRKSQIQTYLEHNEGAGVQHLALATQDIFRTLREMRKRSGIGGFEFMPAPPPTYYRNLKKRAEDVLSDEQIEQCEELGILLDKDDQGTLLQIFTKPVGDRPTLFIEIIQRIGCMHEDEQGQVYQKGGCGGFGKGNFSELFKSIEEYEKMLEAKQTNL